MTPEEITQLLEDVAQEEARRLAPLWDAVAEHHGRISDLLEEA